MSQMPRWYRERLLEQKLSYVLQNDYADIADVKAAKDAIKQKLDQQDREYNQYMQKRTKEYLDKL